MAYTFTFNPTVSGATKRALAELFDAAFLQNGEKMISEQDPIADVETYNSFIANLVSMMKAAQVKNASLPSPLFDQEIGPIHAKKPLTEPVIWGGVVLKKVDVEKDFIQKLLVVDQWGILGFEIHEKKLENLRVLEGLCLVLCSNHAAAGYQDGHVTVQLASIDDTFCFEPNDEHGVIALTNCVIEETSTNHLDDLVYIFKANQI